MIYMGGSQTLAFRHLEMSGESFKLRLLGPILRLSIQNVGARAWESAYLTSSQVMQRMLAGGPNSVIHWNYPLSMYVLHNNLIKLHIQIIMSELPPLKY